MAEAPLPPGFRFHPTDVELIMYYLKRKLMGKKHRFQAITELNIYRFSPWELPDKSVLRSRDREWYFFCPREKKYANGARTQRATEKGFWKATGKDRSVVYNQKTVGKIKTLVFHVGHAPKGKRTDWVMHEFRMEDTSLVDVVQDAFMLCKVFEKSGPGPKNGEQYGAPFNEEEWSDVEEACAETCNTPDLSEDDIAKLLGMFTEDDTVVPVENNTVENFENSNNEKRIESVSCSDGNDIYNDLGDLNTWEEMRNAEYNIATDAALNLYPMHLDFLELNDLTSPLSYPAEANELQLVQTRSIYAPINDSSFNVSYFDGNIRSAVQTNACDKALDGFYFGGDIPSALESVSGLSQHSLLPEASHFVGDDVELLGKGNGIGSFKEAYDFNDNTCDGVSVPVKQAEGSNSSEQIPRRGEQHRHSLSSLQLLLASDSAQPALIAALNAHDMMRAEKLNRSFSHCGSSIHYKAEVTLKVGECTEDALSYLEESAMIFICWMDASFRTMNNKVEDGLDYCCYVCAHVFYYVITCACVFYRVIYSAIIWTYNIPIPYEYDNLLKFVYFRSLFF